MLHAKLFLRTPPIAKPAFYPSETRSVQLYGTEAPVLAQAAHRLVTQYAVKHIDLNFGCPAPKIIKKGGGAAIPEDEMKLFSIVHAVVRAVSGKAAVTCKMRLGVTSHTFLTAARIIEECGAHAITLHTRTAEEAYDRNAARSKWHCLAMLKEAVGIPVLGNGDVFTATDAKDMILQSACDGVVIGRGCLGRPWLFSDIAHLLKGGSDMLTVPTWAQVRDVMVKHLDELYEWQMMNRNMGEQSSVRAMRKWYTWYSQGYRGCERLVQEAYAIDDWQTVRRMFLDFDDIVYIDDAEIIRERGKLGRE